MPVSTIAYNGLTSPLGGSVIVSGTSQASTSGTSIDFTSIPSWVKRVTVMFNGVSSNGASQKLIQIGSGSVTTTGYVASSAYYNVSGSFGNTQSTTGFNINSIQAADVIYGSFTSFITYII